MLLLLDSVNPRHLAALVGYLEEQGFSCTPALRTAGLTRSMLQQPLVPIASVLTAMQELVQTSGRTDLGFVRGLVTQVPDWGDLVTTLDPIMTNLPATATQLNTQIQTLLPGLKSTLTTLDGFVTQTGDVQTALAAYASQLASQTVPCPAQLQAAPGIVSQSLLESIDFVPIMVLLEGDAMGGRELVRLVGQLPKLVIRSQLLDALGLTE